jgi:hypothetical protein
MLNLPNNISNTDINIKSIWGIIIIYDIINFLTFLSLFFNLCYKCFKNLIIADFILDVVRIGKEFVKPYNDFWLTIEGFKED